MKSFFLVLALSVYVLFTGLVNGQDFPFELETASGVLNADLVRREGDTLWIRRLSSAGTPFEAGVQVGELRSLTAPEPRLFEAARQVDDEEGLKNVEVALLRFIRRYEDFRDLEGVPVDGAVFLHGQMLERTGSLTRALKQYQDILDQDYESSFRDAAALRAGIVLAEQENYEKALRFLQTDRFPRDDLHLQSAAWFARANALHRTGQLDEAVQAYLTPVVFHPFIGRNEPKGLLGVLPVYEDLEDWTAARKTVEALNEQYPDAPETEEAQAWAARVSGMLDADAQFDSGLE